MTGGPAGVGVGVGASGSRELAAMLEPAEAAKSRRARQAVTVRKRDLFGKTRCVIQWVRDTLIIIWSWLCVVLPEHSVIRISIPVTCVYLRPFGGRLGNSMHIIVAS